jgi:hypothetical protein
MPVAEPDLDRAVHAAADALTVAGIRAARLQRRLDRVADNRAVLAAELETIRRAIDRLRADLRAIIAATGGTRGTGAGSG